MLYNISQEKVADVAKIIEQLQRLPPYALAYVEGAVNMAVIMTSGKQSA